MCLSKGLEKGEGSVVGSTTARGTKADKILFTVRNRAHSIGKGLARQQQRESISVVSSRTSWGRRGEAGSCRLGAVGDIVAKGGQQGREHTKPKRQREGRERLQRHVEDTKQQGVPQPG